MIYFSIVAGLPLPNQLVGNGTTCWMIMTWHHKFFTLQNVSFSKAEYRASLNSFFKHSRIHFCFRRLCQSFRFSLHDFNPFQHFSVSLLSLRVPTSSWWGRGHIPATRCPAWAADREWASPVCTAPGTRADRHDGVPRLTGCCFLSDFSESPESPSSAASPLCCWWSPEWGRDRSDGKLERNGS